MDEHEPDPNDLVTRRASIVKLGGVLGTALALGGLRLGAGSGTEEAEAAVACVLTPELTEGPYYLDDAKVRRDIRADRPGTPLALALTVLNASSCRPIAGAAVDIWHCDAGGAYSGVQGVSGRFLRGVQRTNANGLARFLTIYPGWYRGRAVHIHVKVHVGGDEVHTGQLFFPEALTDVVYRKAPYSSRPGRDVRNAADSIYRNGGRRGLLTMSRRSAGGYLGRLTMGVTGS